MGQTPPRITRSGSVDRKPVFEVDSALDEAVDHQLPGVHGTEGSPQIYQEEIVDNRRSLDKEYLYARFSPLTDPTAKESRTGRNAVPLIPLLSSP